MPKSELTAPLQELKAPTKYADTQQTVYAHLCPTTQFSEVTGLTSSKPQYVMNACFEKGQTFVVVQQAGKYSFLRRAQTFGLELQTFIFNHSRFKLQFSL